MATSQETTPNLPLPPSADTTEIRDINNIDSTGLDSPPINEDSPVPQYDLLKNNEDDTAKALIVMSINVGNGQNHNLPVMEDDDPYELAKKFCKQYDLDDHVAEALAQNIYASMEQALQEAVNVMDQSYRQSLSPKRENLQEKDDLLEPETGAEVALLRGEPDDQKVALEQIDKQFEDEAADLLARANQKLLEGTIEAKSPKAQEKSGECSPVAKLSVPESLCMDMSLSAIVKPGDTLMEENKDLGANIEKETVHVSVLDQSIQEKNLQNLCGGLTIYVDLVGETSEIVEYPGTTKKPVETQPDEKGAVKSYDRCRTSFSPQRNVLNKGAPSPAKSSRGGKTYGQIFAERESQRPRQRSEGRTRPKIAELQDINKIGSYLNTTTSSLFTKTSKVTENVATEEVERKRSIEKRTKSATRNKKREEPTFKPTINKISQKIIEEKEKKKQSSGTSIHQRLFNESKTRETRRQEERTNILDGEFTFTPSINDYSGTPINAMSFEERNRKFQNKLKQTQESLQEQQLFDNNTGRLLFHPVTGRSPAFDRNRQKLPIGEYLYNRRATTENSKHTISFEGQEMDVSLYTEKIQTILEDQYRNKLENIFDELDSDHDGYISSPNVDIEPVQPFELEIIAPILCSMEELSKVLSKEDFVLEAIDAVKRLSNAERQRFVFGFDKPRYTDTSYDGYPVKSELHDIFEEASTIRKANLDAMYEKIMRDKKAKEEKIRREQERKIEMELQECTFKPNINKKFVKPSKVNH